MAGKQKRSQSKPAQRTMEKLREDGYVVSKVEQYVIAPQLPGGGFRRDLFGLYDLLAVDPVRRIVRGIQCSGLTNVAKHRNEALDNVNLVMCLSLGWTYEIWAWEKIGNRWLPRVEQITLDQALDYANAPES